jgi:RNA polymerase sigma factor (sigma-70 family)
VSSLNRTQDGAFIERIRKHAGILQKVARAYCPVPGERADLIQEMTIALWRSYGRYDSSRSFSTWMYRIALNVAISSFRSEMRHAQRSVAVLEMPETAEPGPEEPRVAVLLECIDQLGPLDKALVLMHLDGFSHAEIADVLGITATNTATKLGRIKDRLRASIHAHSADEGNVYGTR